ncbi:hypothetical protein B0I37DRAFT_348602 [Chaetomium sp. MPI-CAGE-AT-0009]|nr:hypothetical protein B0I37DRAFT_348602 [Chaetomium sp. MPI-CAGE-AT-0009]
MWWATSATSAASPPERKTVKDQDDDPVFIPLPLTTKKHPPQPYSRRDPEWQTFVKMSRNPELQQKIRDHVAQICLDAASRHPLLTSRYGQVTKVQKYWMDIDYPYKAPPVYERTGILVTDDAMTLVTVPYDSWVAKQMERVLWPKPLALGFWALGTATVKQTTLEVARYLGFASEEPGNAQAPSKPAAPRPLPSGPGPEVQKALHQIRQQATRRPEEVNDPGSMSSSASAPSAASSTPRDKPMPLPDKPTLDQNKQHTPDQKSWLQEMVLSVATSQPWQQLKQTYAREQQPLWADPPRGSVCVSGLVELEMAKAYIVLDVITWYDPKTNSRAPGTTMLHLRKILAKNQAPSR